MEDRPFPRESLYNTGPPKWKERFALWGFRLASQLTKPRLQGSLIVLRLPKDLRFEYESQLNKPRADRSLIISRLRIPYRLGEVFG